MKIKIIINKAQWKDFKKIFVIFKNKMNQNKLQI